MPPVHSLVALLALLTSGTALAAGEQDAEPAAASPATELPPAAPCDATPPVGRVLNGHVFLPSAIVPGALTNTSFATYLEVAYGQTTGSAQIGDKLYSGSFDYAGVGAILGYEYAFLDHFSARISITELVYSGINGLSALVMGTSLSTGGSSGSPPASPSATP